MWSMGYFTNVVTVSAQAHTHGPVLPTPVFLKCLHDPDLEGISLG